MRDLVGAGHRGMAGWTRARTHRDGPLEEGQMRTVLAVTSPFAPTAEPGVFRTLEFAEYLPRFGWRPVVLVAHPDKDKPTDPTPLNEIPEGYCHLQIA